MIKRILSICPEGLLGQVECLACCGEFDVCLEIIKVEQSMFYDIPSYDSCQWLAKRCTVHRSRDNGMMEVTEIIFAKICRFCSSWAHKKPTYDTNMLPKVVFAKTEFVKFKISNNFKQNIGETDSKQPKIHRKIHTNLWILKISRKKSAKPKVSILLPNICDLQSKIHRVWI